MTNNGRLCWTYCTIEAMRVYVCCVGRHSVCYSDMQTVDIRQCSREIAVPRSRVELSGVLLEGNCL